MPKVLVESKRSNILENKLSRNHVKSAEWLKLLKSVIEIPEEYKPWKNKTIAQGNFFSLKFLNINFSILEADILSQRTQGSTFSVNESVVSTSNRDFKIMIDLKSGIRHCIHLVASTVQEKEAWISDISQCMDNIHLHSMLSPGLVGSSGGDDLIK